MLLEKFCEKKNCILNISCIQFDSNSGQNIDELSFDMTFKSKFFNKKQEEKRLRIVSLFKLLHNRSITNPSKI